ncbi:hypothetical protein K5D40_10140, partial [Pseudomonas cichorii]
SARKIYDCCAAGRRSAAQGKRAPLFAARRHCIRETTTLDEDRANLFAKSPVHPKKIHRLQ